MNECNYCGTDMGDRDTDFCSEACRTAAEALKMTEKFRRMQEDIDMYYAVNPAGGGCHIVLDDGNVDDRSVRYCITWCKNIKDSVGLDLMNRLLNDFTESERRALYYFAR